MKNEKKILKYKANYFRLSFLLFCSYVFLDSNAQNITTSNINTYIAVNSISISGSGCAGAATTTLNLATNPTTATPTAIAVGDIVLLIQMKGATVSTTDNATFGTPTLNNAGNYEFLRVDAVTATSISFNNGLQNTYTAGGSNFVQVIRVPEYLSTCNVNTNVTGQAWNGTTGGVVALIARGTLNLNANINVNGNGFRGAAVNNNVTSPLCTTTFTTTNASNNGALKGEGIAEFDTNNRRSKGAWANGGGGGNGHNAGGGGGGNANSGGTGGPEWFQNGGGGCNTTVGNGVGGYMVTSSNTRVFMGGGGGAANTNGSGNEGPGGNGGGIIIIFANQINGNNNSITANGTAGANGTEDGASGGGAGGSIYIRCQNYGVTNLTVSATGNKGGDVDNNNASWCHGPGGGGSGGIIRLSIATPANVTTSVAGGAAGIFLTNTVLCAARVGLAGSVGSIINSYLINENQCDNLLLPVVWLFFEGKISQEGTIWLRWATLEEVNHEHFIVEKSNNGIDFFPISNKITDFYNQNGKITNYQFIDIQSLGRVQYYRVKQMDKDGQFSYSKIIAIYNDDTFNFSVSPNPAQKEVCVTIDSTTDVNIIITSTLGAIVYQKTTNQNRFCIDTSTLNGLYVISISNGKNMKIQKIIIIK